MRSAPGGGSVAAIDEVGLLRVGPHSAGADPGPACYGLGGTQPTVTDANLLLGYYDPGFFLGGRMALDREAAETALGTVGTRLGLSAIETAWGIHRLVVENMAAAARIHIVEKGKDPRAYAMVGFGGAGPAHAAEVARVLGVKEVIIPPASGAASALGFLAAPLSFEQVRSHPVKLDAPDAAAVIDVTLHALEADARDRLIAAGVSAADIVTERSADMRLEGQMHEINVPLPDGAITAATVPAIRAAFATIYAARYTSVYGGVGVQAISFRVRCRGPVPELSLIEAGERVGDVSADEVVGMGMLGGGSGGMRFAFPPYGDDGDGGSGSAQPVGRKSEALSATFGQPRRADAARSPRAARKRTRAAWFDGGFIDTPVYDRYALTTGTNLTGPAIIEEREATTVIPPGDTRHS